MNKKLIILGAAIVVFIIVLILFLVLGRTDKTPKPTSSSEANKLVIWDSFDQEEDFAPILNNFKNQNQNFDVEFVKKDPATFETDSINAIAAGNGPDVWIIPSSWLPKHNQKLSTATANLLDSKKKKDNCTVYKDTYIDGIYQDNCLQNEVYGFPLFADSLALYTNTDLMNQKFQAYIKAHPNADPEKVRKVFFNAPKTWDELVTLVKTYGADAIGLGGANVDSASDILVALMLQYGTQMTSADHLSATFHTASNLIDPNSAYPGAKALSFYAGFAQKDNPNYTWDPKSVGSYTRFAKGELAMMIDYTQDTKKLKTANPQLAFNVSALPQITDTSSPKDLLNYQVMTVPKSSTKQALAWQFIRFVGADATSANQYLSKMGLASAQKSTNTDYLTVQNKTSLSWYNPDPTETDKIFRAAIDEILAGSQPQTVMESAAAEITKLLVKLNKGQ